MSRDINLISSKDSNEIKRKKRVKILRIGAIVSLISVSLLAILLFILSNQISLSSIKNNQNSALQGIASLRTKAAKLTLLVDRVNDISVIVGARVDYSAKIALLLKEMPIEAEANVLEVNEKIIDLTVKSDSLLPLNEFIDNLTELAKKKEIVKKLSIQGITFNDKIGSYSLSIRAEIL